MRVHHVDIEVSNHLIEEAKNYSIDEFERYSNELGWEDWMEEFAPDDDYISESEAKFIDSILRESFELAHAENR